jgi:hypothetical protein
MKTKSLLLTIAATIGMTALALAQNVPSYVPTDGLVGWWPFNGNANDESGNGNAGTVNGATLSEDRFGLANAAYDFDGVDDKVTVQNSSLFNFTNKSTIAYWIKYNTNSSYEFKYIAKKGIAGENGNLYTRLTPLYKSSHQLYNGSEFTQLITENSLSPNNWLHISHTYNGNNLYTYINGVKTDSLSAQISLQNNSYPLYFGADEIAGFYSGLIDDIGIWNRALTHQEISTLYNAVSCFSNTTITPQINLITTGNTAIFTATTSDPNPICIWQSDLGQGFQTLNDVENYSGTNTSTLNIANVQLSEHLQPIRVITTSGECVDTSEIATISILDTCVTSINDTTFITVTDTLVINTLITGINPPNNSNTIKVYPNPANSHITIEYGDFAIMDGYQLRIENSLGQEVFQTSITQQSDYLNLNSWGGTGLYFVHIVDPQGNTIDIRKIVLQ